MKKWFLGIGALLVAALVFAQGQHRYLNNEVFYDYLYYVEADADIEPGFDGQLRVDLTSGSSPDFEMYDASAADWVDVAMSTVAETISGAWTFSAAQIFNGNVTLGSNDADDIKVNGPIVYDVFREDFDYVVSKDLEEDFTAAVLTDNGNNMLLMPASQLGVIAYVTESSDGLSAAPSPFDVKGRMSLDTFVDQIDDDAVQFVFGAFGPDQVNGAHDAVWYHQDTN